MKKSLKSRKRPNKSWKRIVFFGRLCVISLFAVVFSFLILFGVSFYQFVRSPFASTSLSEGRAKIDFKRPFSFSFIVLEDKDDPASRVSGLWYIYVDTNQKKLLVFSLSNKMQVAYPRNLGEGSSDKLFAVGELLNNGSGVEVVNKFLERSFAKKVERFVLLDVKGLDLLSKNLDLYEVDRISSLSSLNTASKLPSVFSILREHMETDFTTSEMAGFASFLRTLSQRDVEKHTLDSELPDFTKLDSITQKVFVDESVIAEKKRILVLNGTQLPGTASFAQRFIENLGGSVIGVGNTSKPYDQSFFLYRESLNSDTLKSMTYNLGIHSYKSVEDFLKDGNENTKEADIVVVLGIDYILTL